MSTDTSAVLDLPFIQQNQAQKHVTHNEALALLDLIVQPVVVSRRSLSPPVAPVQGERYIVPAGAAGAFAGQEGRVALWDVNLWKFMSPRRGWRVEVLDEGCPVVFDGTVWLGPEGVMQRAAGLGIATEADPVNRLAVSAEASLLTHAGAGHQLKINKAAAGDTASLLFQTGWSGRAEMGTAGDNDFVLKTSPNGSSFQTALRARAASGAVELPAGLIADAGLATRPGMAFLGSPDSGLFAPAAGQIGLSVAGVQRALLSAAGFSINVPVTGTAVTQSVADRTAGRLAKVGDPGIGGAVVLGGTTPLHERDLPPGNYSYGAGTTPGGPESAAWVHILQVMEASAASTGTSRHRIFLDFRSSGTPSQANSRAWIGWQGTSLTTPILWYPLPAGQFMVGPVSQTAGQPTGAMAERGSNANGDYLRLADGTQICWLSAGPALTCSTAAGTIFSAAAEGVWSFPAAFANSLVSVSAAPLAAGRWASGRCTSTTQAAFQQYAAQSSGTAVTTSLQAIGRWF